MIKYTANRANQRDAQSRKNAVIISVDRGTRCGKLAAHPHPGKVDARRQAVLIDKKPALEQRPNEGEAICHQKAGPVKSKTLLGEDRVFYMKQLALAQGARQSVVDVTPNIYTGSDYQLIYRSSTLQSIQLTLIEISADCVRRWFRVEGVLARSLRRRA